MHIRFALLGLALTACADAPAPPAAVTPGTATESPRTSEATLPLIQPAARSSHEPQRPLTITSAAAEPGIEPAQVAPRGARAARIRELEASRAAYLALAPKDRTAHATEVYRLELLELGQALMFAAGRSKYDALGLRTRAKFVLEELSFDTGEDSDFGLRAYQLLADLHRANGDEEAATTFDEAIERVLTEPE